MHNKGAKMIFIGYNKEHPSDTYRFYNTKTHKVIVSRDITWLDRFYNYDQICKPTEKEENCIKMQWVPLPQVTQPAIIEDPNIIREIENEDKDERSDGDNETITEVYETNMKDTEFPNDHRYHIGETTTPQLT